MFTYLQALVLVHAYCCATVINLMKGCHSPELIYVCIVIHSKEELQRAVKTG